MRIFSVPAGIVDVADLAGAVVEIVIVNGALVETGEVRGRETAVENHETRVKAHDKGDGILVLPCRLRLFDDGFPLELGKGKVRDRIAEGSFIVPLVKGVHIPGAFEGFG